MINGVVDRFTTVRVNGVVHDVWRVLIRKTLCQTDCELTVRLDAGMAIDREMPRGTLGAERVTCLLCLGDNRIGP